MANGVLVKKLKWVQIWHLWNHQNPCTKKQAFAISSTNT